MDISLAVVEEEMINSLVLPHIIRRRDLIPGCPRLWTFCDGLISDVTQDFQETLLTGREERDDLVPILQCQRSPHHRPNVNPYDHNLFHAKSAIKLPKILCHRELVISSFGHG